MAVPVLRFYTRPGCPLCDKAARLLAELAERYPFRVESVDVTREDGLFLRYGVRVPVVGLGARELDPPFDRERLEREIRRWLAEGGGP